MTRDPAEAARLFERAARNGSLAGEVEHAILLFNGDGVPANEPLAAKAFRRAALKGNAIAQNRLARLYVAGRGVPANRIEAAAWHLIAAAQGLTDPWLDDALKDLPGRGPRPRRAARDRAERGALSRTRSAEAPTQRSTGPPIMPALQSAGACERMLQILHERSLSWNPSGRARWTGPSAPGSARGARASA